jgi:hypothetical protein
MHRNSGPKFPLSAACHLLHPSISHACLQAGSATVTAIAPGLAAASLDVHVREPLFRSAWWCERAPEL